MIEVKDLSKQYRDIKAVDSISFHVDEGKIFAFLGPNGAGKTTTIKMLTTLLKPDQGTVSLAGVDVLKDKDAARQKFGIVFQDPSTDDDLTAYENMELHAVFYHVKEKNLKAHIIELLKFVELDDRKDHFVKTFSGGMKRRLEIARSLLHKPNILFLDEPTIGLDPQTRNHLWDYIRGLNRDENTTIFFTTHYMEEAEKIADEIAIIDHGKIVAIGSLDSLKKKTRTKSLEDAFLKLTGRDIRDEEASGKDIMRMRRRLFAKR